MRTRLVFRTLAVVIAAAAVTQAQDAAQESAPSAQAANQRKPAPTPRKVWTDDDVTSLRSPADIHVREKEEQAAEAAVRQTATAKPAADPKPTRPGGPPALSNPKTLEDADKMIAWENRDVEAQQEFVDRLQKEINEAPADQKERLQKLLQERAQILADLRKEQQKLVAQRKELEKKAADNIAAAAPPPSQ
jgi:hypothetical protein